MSNPGPGPRNRTLLAATRAARGFGAGALSIVLAVDLARAGYPDLVVGALLGVAMGGASVWSLYVPRLEGRIGRRTLFSLGAVALATGGALLWFDLANLAVVLVALLLGGIVAGTADISPLAALEQTVLADSTSDRIRTRSFSLYNLAGYVGTALGALSAGTVTEASLALPFGLPAGPRDTVLVLYAMIGIALVPVYATLSSTGGTPAPAGPRPRLSGRSRSIILSLSGLFTVDAFGGGLIANSLVSYYLLVRFHPSLGTIGVIFFAANLAAAGSLLAAAPLARRFGLVNTMVFSHIPSNLLLIAFAFSPTVVLAGVLWTARATLSQMDVPTRQSYTQAVVPPSDRAAAAGYTTGARSTQMFGAPVTGAFLAIGGPWLAGPFVLAGSVKVAYDLALYRRFRKVPPPEEAGPPGPPSPPAAPIEGTPVGAPAQKGNEVPRYGSRVERANRRGEREAWRPESG